MTRLLLLLPFLAALPATAQEQDDPPQLSYHLPEGDASAALAEVYAPPWAEGTTLYAAVDGVALREAPSSQGRRWRTLPAGTRVRVVRCDAELRPEAGFVHHWVAVEVEETLERGHVFGGFLTPLAIVADLDADRRSEVATVSFTSEAQVVVRIYSPGRSEQSVSFRVAGEAYLSHRGGTVKAALIPASEAGLPSCASSPGRRRARPPATPSSPRPGQRRSRPSPAHRAGDLRAVRSADDRAKRGAVRSGVALGDRPNDGQQGRRRRACGRGEAAGEALPAPRRRVRPGAAAIGVRAITQAPRSVSPPPATSDSLIEAGSRSAGAE